MEVYQTIPNAVFKLHKDVISRNYHYALVVKIPRQKDIDKVIDKLRQAYPELSPQQRHYWSKRGRAVFRVVMVKPERIAWIAAKGGDHPTFFKNPNLRNIKRHWVQFGQYEIKIVGGNVRIRVTDLTYEQTFRALLKKAFRQDKSELEEAISNIAWYHNHGTLKQKISLINSLNRQRKIHHLPLLNKDNL